MGVSGGAQSGAFAFKGDCGLPTARALVARTETEDISLRMGEVSWRRQGRSVISEDSETFVHACRNPATAIISGTGDVTYSPLQFHPYAHMMLRMA